MITLTEARQWRKQRGPARKVANRSAYAPHARLIIDLAFDPKEPWTASDIARLLQAKDAKLKKEKLNTLIAAICRRIHTETKRREPMSQAASPPPQ